MGGAVILQFLVSAMAASLPQFLVSAMTASQLSASSPAALTLAKQACIFLRKYIHVRGVHE
jgi:hypothetical protein